MNEETDTPLGGAEVEAIAETSQVDLNAEDTNAQPTGADDAGQADDAGEATKRVPWFQKRIDEVTAKKYEAEREAAYWRGIAEASRNGQQPTEQQQVEVPDRYEDPDGYDRWLIQQAKEAAKAELVQERTARSFEEREAATRTSKPDYDAVVRDPSLRITEMMAEVIRESDKGPDIAYHLGTNRSEAARIANLPPHLQAKELGRIEASLSTAQAPAPKRNPPPAPPQTVNGLSAGLPKPAEDMSMAEYIAARNAGNI